MAPQRGTTSTHEACIMATTTTAETRVFNRMVNRNPLTQILVSDSRIIAALGREALVMTTKFGWMASY